MFGSNPFGQSSSSPFGSPSVFGQQANNANNNPFAPKPFGSTGTFGSQTGSSIFGGTSTGVFGAQASSPLGSTSVFGASSSPAFGSSSPAFGASTTSAFGSTSSAFGGSSAFGQKPAFGGFGASTTQTSPFGSSFQQSQPAFGSNLFGSTTPFGAQSQPGYGSSTTSAFGAASNPAFGAGATSSSAFGASSSPAFGSTGGVFGAASSPFGSSSPAFGASSPAFGATAPAFGATTSPAFGATNIPAFGATTSPAFGATSTPAFGATTTPGFGASSSPAFGSSAPSFGFGSSTSAFGQSASTFGSSPFAASPFGSQSSSFGTQTTTPSFGAQSSFGGQRGGSRVAPYTSTPEADGGTSTQPAGKLESISAMTVYKDKSHEELRWEDYQSGDKGGPAPAGQSSAAGFGSSPFASSSTPAFATTSVNPFSSSSSVNPFASKTPTFSSTGFGSTTSTSVFGSSPSPFSVTGTATTSSPFGSTPSSAFGPSTSPSIFNTSSPGFGSPSMFGPSSSQGTTSTFGTSLGFGNTQSSPLFQSTTPTLQPVSSPFGQTSSPFGQTTTNPGFGQPSLFNTPSTGFGGNMFSTSSQSNISPLNFGQTTPTLTTSFQSAQPTQSSGGFSFSTFGQSQPAFSIGGTPGILGSGGIGQPSGTPASVMPPAAQITNPFGSLPAMPQISISRTGTSPAVQYGISSLPVVEKPVPIRISSLLTSRHLSQRRPRLPVRKYNPKTDGLKVPFFSDEEETPSTPKADAFFVPRENPRALIIRPLEQWSSRPSSEKLTASKGATTPLHENGERQEDAYASTNGHGTNDRNNLFAKKPVENGLSNKEQPDAAKGNNGKANGAHDASSDKGDSYITLTGHRAGEAAIVYEHGADIEALMPKLRHSDYYTEPRIQELAAKERADPGYCRHVKDFVVGRQGYGCIKFFGETDVRRLDLQSLVQFNNREVIVYMDESKKPPVGQGLNKPAEVTLLNVKCFDKKTGQQYTEGPRIEKYREMLRRKAEEQGAEFVSYDPVKGEWKFRVDHFSAYKLGDEDESAERDEES